MTEAAATARPSSPLYTEPSWLTVGDLDVAYRRKGSGEALVFLHGAGGTRMWIPFYERLSERVDLIAPEHPGFGDTAFPNGSTASTTSSFTTVTSSSCSSSTACISSATRSGGWIAAHLAITYPERLKSLTLITPAGMHVPEAPRPDLFAMAPEAIPDVLFNGDFMPYLDYLPNPTILDEIVHAYGEMGRSRGSPGIRATTRSSRAGCRGSASRRS